MNLYEIIRNAIGESINGAEQLPLDPQQTAELARHIEQTLKAEAAKVSPSGYMHPEHTQLLSYRPDIYENPVALYAAPVAALIAEVASHAD